MRHFALIGRTLTHSYSKRLFDDRRFDDADYKLCPMPSVEGLREWVEREGIDGFNVTNPYKQDVIPLLDDLTPEARAIGAVNCVVVRRHPVTLIGHNTDAPAFRDTLSSFTSLLSPPTSAFILGTGGGARAVAYALGQMAIPYLFVSRTPEKHTHAIGYNQLFTSHLSPFTLLVNATPVGTYPEVDRTPLDLTLALTHLPINAFVYDLVYNPSPTLLMQQAAAAGATVCDGMAMLRRQAELSWKLWDLL